MCTKLNNNTLTKNRVGDAELTMERTLTRLDDLLFMTMISYLRIKKLLGHKS